MVRGYRYSDNGAHFEDEDVIIENNNELPFPFEDSPFDEDAIYNIDWGVDE
jgi:hypothetical protein